MAAKAQHKATKTTSGAKSQFKLEAKRPAKGHTNPAEVAALHPEKPKLGVSKNLKDYVELIETVARVEYSRLPNHLIDYSELVNIGAIALHTMFKANPERVYNVTYLSTAIKWAVRNELRFRYKWYALKTTDNKNTEETAGGEFDEDASPDKVTVREAVYETILSMEGMMEADNPHELRDESGTPEDHSEVREMAVLVREAIAKLPEREKMIIEARFFKNMKMREIGARFDISPSRTSRIVQSGLDKVKAELLRRGYAG
ncbi:MAG: sigma-70 family RNA polymerase sigma factor [Vampirovibrionales bacterium]|nr:sigma-70 family RNA polymerase sigma factor [Vampirovibrionales bacterium]